MSIEAGNVEVDKSAEDRGSQKIDVVLEGDSRQSNESIKRSEEPTIVDTGVLKANPDPYSLKTVAMGHNVVETEFRKPESSPWAIGGRNDADCHQYLFLQCN